DLDEVDDDDDNASESTPEGYGHNHHGVPSHNGGGGIGIGNGGGFGDSMDQAGQSMELEPRSFSRGAGGQLGYEPAACDMPNEEDIASSVPIDITFMDPSAMHWGNRSGNGNTNAGAGAAALGRSASSEGWAGGAAEPVNGGHAAGFSG
ncbi:unnamed protein product, partial [Ectocarpus sp. 12 AP-2014]